MTFAKMPLNRDSSGLSSQARTSSYDMEKHRNITVRFADEIYEITRSGFPARVGAQAKRLLLDYLGAALAGALLVKEKGNKYLDCFGPAHSGATVIGFRRKSGVQNAAFMNGFSSHVAELDDGERTGMFHPGAPVISAVLAAAETNKISGSDFLIGLITGYEACVRLASAIQPSHRDCGRLATGTAGTVGAAAGVAAALGSDRTQIGNTLSAAASGASGILRIIEDGSELKPFNAGLAAADGLFSAFSGFAGFRGPEDILGGEKGFMQLMAEHYDLSALWKDRGGGFCVEKVYLKPYAACRHCHPAIEAALLIKSKKKISPEKIKAVSVRTYRHGVEKNKHSRIHGITSAKMSTPYSVACALIFGRAGIEEYMPERIKDPEILSLAEKVKVFSDDRLSALVPKKRPAIVEVKIDDDRSYTERVDLPKGEPETPLSDREIEEKFISLAAFAGKPAAGAREIICRVMNLETDLEKLFSLL